MGLLTLGEMNPDPTRIELGGNIFEVRLNLIVNNLPVERETLVNTEHFDAAEVPIAAAALGLLSRQPLNKSKFTTAFCGTFNFVQKSARK